MSLPPLDDGDLGDDEPDTSAGAPPHPMDRIWRHPSELPAVPESSGRSRRRSGPTRLRSALLPLGAGAVGALLTVGVLAAAGVFDRSSTPTAASRTAPRTTDAIISVTKRIAPAIVAVSVVGKRGTRTGSGVCIHRAGQVITSDRLVADTRSITVVTSDGTVHAARVVGRDPSSDLALLAINENLDAADLAAPATLRIGDPVYAVASDAAGAPWVSGGMVSSLDGRVTTDGTTMSGLIEINAVPEPFVAGGALLDGQGRVVGILMTPVDGHAATIAVPISFAARVADALMSVGHVDHGWLGLAGKVRSRGGLEITALAQGGPSQRAGIHVGDVIVKFDTQPIATMNDLMAAARGHWPGDHVRLVVARGHSDLTVPIQLSRKPTAFAPSTTAAAP